MKLKNFLVPLLLVLWHSTANSFSVSGVQAQLRDGTQVVDITYDLQYSQDISCSISVQATLDGFTWHDVKAVSGDVGDAVAPGSGLQIVWDAGSEWQADLYPNVRIRVLANGQVASGPAPAGFSLVYGSRFLMGSPEDEPGRYPDEVLHKVKQSRSFYISQLETTWDDWNAVRDWALLNGYPDIAPGADGHHGSGDGSHPVTQVSWFDALKWCNALSEKEGLSPVYKLSANGDVIRAGEDPVYADWEANGYRLPTESEWEYACRAGSTSPFFTGSFNESMELEENLDRAGWYVANSGGTTQGVGQKLANDLGIFDMHGNVWEWCWDWYSPYEIGYRVDPKGGLSGTHRVARGGSWLSLALSNRSALRSGYHPETRQRNLGFRIARTAFEIPVADAGVDIFQEITGSGESARIRLSATGSTSFGNILSWDWSWIGGSSSGQNPSINVPIGSTEVTLTITDEFGNTKSDTITVTVERVEEGPIADAGPDQVLTDMDGDGFETTILDASASIPFYKQGFGYYTINSWEWTWSGGSVQGQFPEINFPVGENVILLRVQDIYGGEAFDSVTVTVKGQSASPPIPNSDLVFSRYDADGDGLEVILLDGSDAMDEGSVVAWDWSWEGGSASGEFASSSFPAGITPISLTLTDNDGNASTWDGSVRVIQTPEKFEFIPQGRFIMGSPEDEPGRVSVGGFQETFRPVILTRPFLMSATETRWSEWNTVRDWALANGYNDFDDGRNGYHFNVEGDHPVSQFIFRSAYYYCNARSEIEGRKPVYYAREPFIQANIYKDYFANGYPTVPLVDWTADGYRLPTEAEWEYAARAGTTTAYFGGKLNTLAAGDEEDALDPYAWFAENSIEGRYLSTREPAGKLPNAWGLYDMHGNVWEGVWDAITPEGLAGTRAVDPVAISTSTTRITRGGSFYDGAGKVRSATRAEWMSNSPYFGFRTVLNSGITATRGGPDIRKYDIDGDGFEQVTLTAKSISANGQIVSTEWGWGSDTATGERINPVFPVGETLVTLTVVDSDGVQATDEVLVSIIPIHPQFSHLRPDVFTMGSPGDETGRDDSETQHPVFLRSSFDMGKTEVTNARMAEVLKWAYDEGKITVTDAIVAIGDQPLMNLSLTDSRIQFATGAFTVESGYEDFPVVAVNWYGAVAYAHFKSLRDLGSSCYDLSDWSCDFSAAGYRLPTQAEWEFAARAGTSTAFHSGDLVHSGTDPLDTNLDLAGWYGANSGSALQAVGGKQPNAWGLYDFHGNVAEWCWDWSGSYPTQLTGDPVGPAEGVERVLRGGDFLSNAEECRSAAIRSALPDHMDDKTGFRILLSRGAEGPLAVAGDDISTWDQDEDGTEPITMDAVFSRDLNGLIHAWDWSWTGGTFSGEILEADFPVGQTLLVLRVTDSSGLIGLDAVTIQIDSKSTPPGFVYIPSGSFLMGSPEFIDYSTEEFPEIGREDGIEDRTTQQINQSFFAKKTEVTNAELVEVFQWALEQGSLTVNDGMIETGARELLDLGAFANRILFTEGIFTVQSGFEDHPVTDISWYGAIAYAHFRSLREGKPSCFNLSNWSVNPAVQGYRLPTQVEWEYMCRAGTRTAFHTGDITYGSYSPLDPNLDAAGWYGGNSGGVTQPVRGKQSNQWGLYDMHGNVLEWCLNGPSIEEKYIRGGSYVDFASLCRSAQQRWISPQTREPTIGFRIVLNTPEPPES